MARKSRYNTDEATAVSTQKTWNTAVYARLSNEDGGIKGSDSIDTQIYLVKQYIEERAYLKLCSVFSDNGETGTNFDRPQFNKLMDDVKAGKINCIVVKDLSRFGRNYIETGNYMEKIFPFLGVRFISINDGYDSINPQNSSEVLAIALKSLIHDIYAKDASRKISAAFAAKQKRGEFLGGCTPYGYLKNPECWGKLIIDVETAPVVRDIFKWKIEGLSVYKIPRKLNDLGISCPSRYWYEKGFTKNIKYANNKNLWIESSIKRILTNPVYTGCMAQGKTQTSLIQGLRTKATKPEEWLVIPDMHEPIIDKETFDAVQRLFEITKAKYDKKIAKKINSDTHINIFKGLIICGDCKSRIARRPFGKNDYYFVCTAYERNANRVCSKKSIKENDLTQTVLSQIQNQIKLFSDMEKLIKKLQNNNRNPKNTMQNKTAEIKRTIQEKEKRLAVLYDDYSDGVLNKDEYLFMKAKYSEEKRLLQDEYDNIIFQSVKQNDALASSNKWLSAVTKFKNQTELTREMLIEIVDKIVVTKYNNVEVIFKHRNEYKELVSSTAEVENLIIESEAV